MVKIEVAATHEEPGRRGAVVGMAALEEALARRGQAVAVLATGTSQFDLLSRLAAAPFDWKRVTFYHLDEYIGLPDTHPASFRRYLKERFLELLPVHPAAFHFIDGEASDPVSECVRLGELIRDIEVDLALVGIGENGHPRTIVCTVPEMRKARPVKLAFSGPVTAGVPASILQRHPRCRVFLDRDSASELDIME